MGKLEKNFIREVVNNLLNKTEDGKELDIKYLEEQLRDKFLDEDTYNEAIKILYSFVQPVIMKQERKVEVINFPNPVEPITDIKINNFGELKDSFKYLEDAIKSINIEVPIVNVPAPIINIPEAKETVVNVPELDLYPLLEEIEKGLKKLRTNNKSNPLAVRLTDGTDWIKEIVKIQKETSKAIAAFAGGSNQIRLVNSNMTPVNPATSDSPSTLLHNLVTVTTAGTEVQVSATSVPIKGITIKSLAANTGTMYVGSSTVSSTNGYPLAAGQAISFDISNLNTIWIDASVSGEKVSYLAVN